MKKKKPFNKEEILTNEKSNSGLIDLSLPLSSPLSAQAIGSLTASLKKPSASCYYSSKSISSSNDGEKWEDYAITTSKNKKKDGCAGGDDALSKKIDPFEK